MTALIIGFVTNLLTELLRNLLTGFKYRKLLPYLSKVFTVVDPLIKENFASLSEHSLYEIVAYAALAVGDEDLSASEILSLTKLFFQMFKIEKALEVKLPNVESVSISKASEIKSQVDEAVQQFKSTFGSAKDLFGTKEAK